MAVSERSLDSLRLRVRQLTGTLGMQLHVEDQTMSPQGSLKQLLGSRLL